MPDSKSKRASSISASLVSVSPSLEGVADLVLCPRLVLLRPLEELLELDLDLDLAGDLLWDLDRDTDRDLLLSLRPEPDLDTEPDLNTERDLDLLRSSSSVSAIDCLID